MWHRQALADPRCQVVPVPCVELEPRKRRLLVIIEDVAVHYEVPDPRKVPSSVPLGTDRRAPDEQILGQGNVQRGVHPHAPARVAEDPICAGIDVTWITLLQLSFELSDHLLTG